MALRLERFSASEKGESLEQSDEFARGLALVLSAKTPLTGIAQGLNFLTGEVTLVWRHSLNYIIPNLFFGYIKDGNLLFMFMFYSFFQMYYYSDVQTTHTTYPDGLEVLQFPRFEYSKMCYTPEVS